MEHLGLPEFIASPGTIAKIFIRVLDSQSTSFTFTLRGIMRKTRLSKGHLINASGALAILKRHGVIENEGHTWRRKLPKEGL